MQRTTGVWIPAASEAVGGMTGEAGTNPSKSQHCFQSLHVLTEGNPACTLTRVQYGNKPNSSLYTVNWKVNLTILDHRHTNRVIGEPHGTVNCNQRRNHRLMSILDTIATLRKGFPVRSNGFTVGAPVSIASAAPETALRCRSLSKSFDGVAAVADFNLTIRRGQVTALVGPSGCGKTTALRMIAGFETPDEGSIAINGHPVAGLGANVPPEKRRVGMVFQEGALFPHASVAQNVGYGLGKEQNRRDRVDEMLALVGLEDFRDRMPHELSGGQQQRVALARALAPRPEVLLLDEPFSNLDPGLREQVRSEVMGIVREHGVTAVFVTHDQDEALLLGDVVAVMHDGRIEQSAAPETVFHHPATRFVAEFLGTADFLPAKATGGSIESEIGAVSSPPGANGSARLEVMVRPDCIECIPCEDGTGTIVHREFRGAFLMYRVALESGATVRCLLSHTQDYPVGTRVEVRLRNGHALLPFADGAALSASSELAHSHR